ncbi:hypothetical protein M413DRAFT_72715, partial [Hebeloma cylindrosporum]
YGYTPSRVTAFIFITIFSISFQLHAFQAIRYRLWWLLPSACLCGTMELAGWSGRLWSTYDPLAMLPFQIQISATMLAPTPLLAANFMIFGEVIKRLGISYSRLTPRWYTVLFTTSDILSLFVQGAGGGVASGAKDVKGQKLGSNIMLAGIIFQLVVIVIFALCATEYLVRYNKGSPVSKRSADPESVRGEFTRKVKMMVYALTFTTTCLFIRAVYRVIELAGGWQGKIIHTQVYFNVLDGAMIVLAMCTLNIFHPGILLKAVAPETEKDQNSSAASA